MGQGIFAGLLSGTVVSGLAVGSMSLMAGPPNDRVRTVVDLNVPKYSGFEQDDVASDVASQVEKPKTALSGAASLADDLSKISESISASTAKPDVDGVDLALADPGAQDDGAAVDVTSDTPVSKVPQAKGVDAPGSGDGLSVSTEPAQPSVSDTDTQDSAFDAAPDADVQEDAQDSGTQQVAAADVSGSSGTIDNIATGVKTDRLPSIGADTDDGAVLGQAPETDSSVFGGDTSAPPIERYASTFENPENKPLMAVVLVVDQETALNSDALADFPYPVSFAINVNNPDAVQISQRLRAAGHEVLAQIDLPEGADAKSTEEAMQVYLNAVPEAVAVIEGLDGGIQANRQASKQLAPILRDSGHGAVLLSNGLNTAQKLIARAGVPSGSVFRDFDAQGQSERMIRRFLDQGAFRAGQEKEGVIMLGRLRQETAKALVVWALEDRSGRVALAPVSAVLSAEKSKVAFGQ